MNEKTTVSWVDAHAHTDNENGEALVGCDQIHGLSNLQRNEKPIAEIQIKSECKCGHKNERPSQSMKATNQVIQPAARDICRNMNMRNGTVTNKPKPATKSKHSQ